MGKLLFFCLLVWFVAVGLIGKSCFDDQQKRIEREEKITEAQMSYLELTTEIARAKENKCEELLEKLPATGTVLKAGQETIDYILWIVNCYYREEQGCEAQDDGTKICPL